MHTYLSSRRSERTPDYSTQFPGASTRNRTTIDEFQRPSVGRTLPCRQPVDVERRSAAGHDNGASQHWRESETIGASDDTEGALPAHQGLGYDATD